MSNKKKYIFTSINRDFYHFPQRSLACVIVTGSLLPAIRRISVKKIDEQLRGIFSIER